MIISRDMYEQYLRYRGEQDVDFIPRPFRITIPHARQNLQNALALVMRHQVDWLPEYNSIAEWLSDNKGKGLLLIGPPGVGKTETCMRVIPLLTGMFYHRNFTCHNSHELCNEQTCKDIVRRKFVVIDDVGIEGFYNDYGNPHIVFSEVVDNIERIGTLLLATTNLTIDELQQKYGSRTMDRLRAYTKLVVIKSKSMRGKYEKG